MELMTKCKQCGEVLPDSMFRKNYYNGKPSRTCLKCEKINSRAKYLIRKGDKATQAEKSELAKIEQLYMYQVIAGLKPPRRRAELQRNIEAFDELLSKYEKVALVDTDELHKWLIEELTDTPEYYMDTVYEQLLSKYRPVLRIDQSTMMPVYDETHLEVLNKILERFSDYEDNYYN